MKNAVFPCLLLWTITTSAQVTVTVDATKEYQTISGFGGFGAAKPFWEAAPYYDAGYLSTAIDELGVTIFRTQIYWDGEPTNDNGDPNSINPAGFNFGPSSNNGKQFSWIKDLSDRGAKLLATVWTPPLWMKLRDQDNRIPNECYNCWQCAKGAPGTEMCGGRLNPEHYDEFAEYLVAYVRTLKEKTGVDLYAISIQNEPYFANPFESNVVLPAEYADLLKVVAQRFNQEGLPTLFFGPEHMAEWSWFVQRDYVNETLNDPAVKPHLDIYAVHSYVDGVAADYGSAEGWTALHDNITAAHGKPLWMTETSDFSKSGFELGFSMAKSLYLALRFGRISAWVYWSMHDAVIAQNRLTPLGYSFRNFYRFVRPGAVVIEAASSDPEILALAFRHPATTDLTIILINNGATEKRVNYTTGTDHGELITYRTSETENCVELGPAPATELVLPARSITTLSSSDPKEVVSVGESEGAAPVIAPNPASSFIDIRIPSGNRSSKVAAYDMLGKLVAHAEVGGETATLDVRDWKSGVYVVRVLSGGRETVLRFVKDATHPATGDGR